MARKKALEPKSVNQKDSSAKTAPEVPGQLSKSVGDEAVTRDPEASPGASAPEAATLIGKMPQESEPTDAATTAADVSPGDKTAETDDADTGKAVDDIAAHEADTMLAVQDALGRKRSQPDKPSWKAKLKKLLKSKRLWTIVAIVILLLFTVPVTRYKIIGLFIKKQVSVTVLDSKTATPVSYATVTANGKAAKTNANGTATFKTAPGSTKLIVSKQYYTTYNKLFFVGLGSGARAKVGLVATGRQVPLTILNKLTGQPLANATITVLKTAARTDARGHAVIVLPASEANAAGTVSLRGYNLLKTNIQVTNDVVSANTFNLTPTGHVYFLSNISGTMDVVKTNLDGSGRQVVLEGTDQEDRSTMSLLATRDWRYLVLKSRRDTAQPVLYLIDTSNDKVTQFDSNNGSFNLIGWYGHNFMYDFVSNSVPQSQNGHEVIKSYDADHQQLNQLDQSQAASDQNGYAFQDFYNFSVLNNQLVYNTQWYSGGADLAGKNASIRGIQPDGQNKKDYQTFPSAGLNYVLNAPYQPQAVYYGVYNGGSGTTYYNFANQAVNAVSLDQSYFKKNYPTYLASPSGNQTFWIDENNNLFVGDKNAQRPKQLAGLAGYKPYGWFSDNYLLLSKGGTDLYITPASSLKPGQQPFKISYFYSQIPKYPNYSYGYGGL